MDTRKFAVAAPRPPPELETDAKPSSAKPWPGRAGYLDIGDSELRGNSVDDINPLHHLKDPKLREVWYKYYSLLWVMQDLCHQPLGLETRNSLAKPQG